MYSSENYFWGLTAYYLGVALVMLYLFNYRKLIPWVHFRNVVLVFIAALLITPVKAYPDLDYLAPAWFVSVYATLVAQPEEITRAIVPLIVVTIGALVAYIGAAIAMFKLKAKPKPVEPAYTEQVPQQQGSSQETQQINQEESQ